MPVFRSISVIIIAAEGFHLFSFFFLLVLFWDNRTRNVSSIYYVCFHLQCGIYSSSGTVALLNALKTNLCAGIQTRVQVPLQPLSQCPENIMSKCCTPAVEAVGKAHWQPSNSAIYSVLLGFAFGRQTPSNITSFPSQTWWHGTLPAQSRHISPVEACIVYQSKVLKSHSIAIRKLLIALGLFCLWVEHNIDQTPKHHRSRGLSLVNLARTASDQLLFQEW